jgi:hypothetical protein
MAGHRGENPPGRRGAPRPGARGWQANQKLGKRNAGSCSTSATPGQGPDDAEAKRRERLCAAVDREIEADRIFFRLNPGLEYRMRVTGAAEFAELEERFGLGFVAAPPGLRLFTLIRSFHPKLRLRTWVAGPDSEAAASQEELATLWREAAGTGPIDDVMAATAARLRAEGDAS